MPLINSWSIRKKLTGLMLFTSLMALTLATLIFMLYLARVTGENCVAALSFDEPESAGETLAGLKGLPEVLYALVIRKDGSLFCRI